MRVLLCTVLGVLSLCAADRDFNGRWDITVPNNEKKRAWWLEVKDAGTAAMSGRFVGGPGGQMDDLPGLQIENGELRFAVKDYKYTARFEGGKLTGTLDRPDGPPLQWTGVRAPKLAGGDPAKFHPGDPVELFNGKDLTGWTALRPEIQKVWHVVNGLLTNEAGASDIVSTQKFWNFTLHTEYALAPKSNSGIALRGRYEVQLYEDYGEPATLHGNGALYSRIVPVLNASKPAGQWQTLDVTLIGNEVTVILNQAKVIDRKEIEGLTAMASDPQEAEPGPIQIQGDHGAVAFRKITVTPLLKGKPKK